MISQAFERHATSCDTSIGLLETSGRLKTRILSEDMTSPLHSAASESWANARSFLKVYVFRLKRYFGRCFGSRGRSSTLRWRMKSSGLHTWFELIQRGSLRCSMNGKTRISRGWNLGQAGGLSNRSLKQSGQ